MHIPIYVILLCSPNTLSHYSDVFTYFIKPFSLDMTKELTMVSNEPLPKSGPWGLAYIFSSSKRI